LRTQLVTLRFRLVFIVDFFVGRFFPVLMYFAVHSVPQQSSASDSTKKLCSIKNLCLLIYFVELKQNTWFSNFNLSWKLASFHLLDFLVLFAECNIPWNCFYKTTSFFHSWKIIKKFYFFYIFAPSYRFLFC